MTKRLPESVNSALLILCSIVVFTSNAQTFSWAKRFGVANAETLGSANLIDLNGNISSMISFTGILDVDPGANVTNINSVNGSGVNVRLSPTGSLVSYNQFSNPSGFIFINEAGEYIITDKFSGTIDLDPGAGYFPVSSAGYNDIYIAKLDAYGNFIWGKVIGGLGSEYPQGLIVNSHGNIYINGSFGNVGTTGLDPAVDFDPDPDVEYIMYPSTDNNSFILCLGTNGEFKWVQKQKIISLKDTDNQGNLYMWGAIDEIPAENTTYISKMGSDGKKIWSKYIANTSLQIGGLSVNDAGEVLVSGGFSGSIFIGSYNIAATTVQDPFYTKMDVNGDVVFAKSIRTNGFINDINFDNNGDIYFTGYFTSTGNIDFDPGPGVVALNCKGNMAAYVEKLSNSGNLIWVKQIGGEGKSRTRGQKIIISNNGDVYTSIRCKGTVDFDPGAGKAIISSIGTWDFVLHKLTQTNSGSREVQVTTLAKTKQLTVFPNPNPGSFVVDVPAVGEKGKLELIDSRGVVVYTRTFNGSYPQKLHVVTKYARGNYLIKITGSLYTYTSHLLIQ